jgi:hypothetical protein
VFDVEGQFAVHRVTLSCFGKDRIHRIMYPVNRFVLPG